MILLRSQRKAPKYVMKYAGCTERVYTNYNGAAIVARFTPMQTEFSLFSCYSCSFAGTDECLLLR